jgi:hypothetical protein
MTQVTVHPPLVTHLVSASFIFQPPLMPVMGLAIISSSNPTDSSPDTTWWRGM